LGKSTGAISAALTVADKGVRAQAWAFAPCAANKPNKAHAGKFARDKRAMPTHK
jgi:hypothetical protein